MEFLHDVSKEVVVSVTMAILAALWRLVVSLRGKPLEVPPPPTPASLPPPAPAAPVVAASAASGAAPALPVGEVEEPDSWWWATTKDILWFAFVAGVLLAALGLGYWFISVAAGFAVSMIRRGTNYFRSMWDGE